MAAADVIAALAVILKADAAIAALVGARVFGIELPAEEAVSMPRKAIVLRPAGGTSPIGGYAKHTGQRVDVISWGETPYEADRLAGEAFVALQQLRRQAASLASSRVLIHSADPAGGRFALRDAETNWPASTQPFQIFFAIEAIAA